jgi:hypothetical protein
VRSERFSRTLPRLPPEWSCGERTFSQEVRIASIVMSFFMCSSLDTTWLEHKDQVRGASMGLFVYTWPNDLLGRTLAQCITCNQRV